MKSKTEKVHALLASAEYLGNARQFGPVNERTGVDRLQEAHKLLLDVIEALQTEIAEAAA